MSYGRYRYINNPKIEALRERVLNVSRDLADRDDALGLFVDEVYSHARAELEREADYNAKVNSSYASMVEARRVLLERLNVLGVAPALEQLLAVIKELDTAWKQTGLNHQNRVGDLDRERRNAG